MPAAKKGRSQRAAAKTDLARVPAPVTPADRIVLEIRKFIAATIFFNAQAAEKVGLGLTDMQMIHMLQLYGPATPSQLAAGTGLSSGGVTVALDRLEKAGYIRRQPNPADRRSLLVTLIPSSLPKLAGLYERMLDGGKHAILDRAVTVSRSVRDADDVA
ncbi:MAG TPA: MarR family transcriptional regulator, partial [Xanthobacteraceae bacterium]